MICGRHRTKVRASRTSLDACDMTCRRTGMWDENGSRWEDINQRTSAISGPIPVLPESLESLLLSECLNFSSDIEYTMSSIAHCAHSAIGYPTVTILLQRKGHTPPGTTRRKGLCLGCRAAHSLVQRPAPGQTALFGLRILSNNHPLARHPKVCVPNRAQINLPLVSFFFCHH